MSVQSCWNNRSNSNKVTKEQEIKSSDFEITIEFERKEVKTDGKCAGTLIICAWNAAAITDR